MLHHMNFDKHMLYFQKLHDILQKLEKYFVLLQEKLKENNAIFTNEMFCNVSFKEEETDNEENFIDLNVLKAQTYRSVSYYLLAP